MWKLGQNWVTGSLWPDYNDVGLISTPVSNNDKELMMAPAQRAGATVDVILF